MDKKFKLVAGKGRGQRSWVGLALHNVGLLETAAIRLDSPVSRRLKRQNHRLNAVKDNVEVQRA